MANAFLNETQYLSNAVLLIAKNQLVTAKLVDTRYEDKVNDDNNLSFNIKRSSRFAENDASLQSAAFDPQDLVIGSANLAVNQYAKAHCSIGDLEHVKSFNDLMENTAMKAAGTRISTQIDTFLQKKVRGFAGYVGHATTPTNNIGSPAEFNPVHTRLMDMGVPNADLNATVTFGDGEEIRGSLISGNIDNVNRTALEKVRIPILSEINVYATQQCPSITTGSRAGTTLIDNGTLSVNYRDVKDTQGALGGMYMTIHVDGLSGATQTLKAGEILTIADVYAYDWRNNQTLSYLQQFVVQEDVTAAGSEFDIKVAPPIIVPNTSDGVDTKTNTAFATVNAAAVDGAAVTFLGAASTTYRVRAAWHKSAIKMVSAKLRTPDTGKASFSQDPETGISIRVWKFSDPMTGAHGIRFDATYGATLVDSLMGSRVSGT